MTVATGATSVGEARAVLARYLRQLEELGGPSIYLTSLDPSEAVAAVRRIAGTGETAREARGGPVAHAGGGVGAPPDSPALRVLAQEAAVCTRCRLSDGRRNVVFGVGDGGADLVVVGEAPGSEEDRTGLPFVGRAGKMLDLLLMSAGFPRESVYICNVLKSRPPNNRDPQADEVAACTTAFLHPQLDEIAPRVLLAVGRFAAHVLTGADAPIGRLRGRVHVYRGTPVVVSYHPAYLLRSPHLSRVAWEDFQLVRKVLDEQRV